MGEVILLPGRPHATEPSPAVSVRPSLCRGTVGDTNILFSIDPSSKGHVVLPEEVMEALPTSNRAFWASDCIPMCKMRLQSEAARSIPTNRSCRFCDPVSGRCRGLCVRPCSPKSGREILRRHYRTMSFAQARLHVEHLSVARQEVQNVSTPAQFHTVGPG